MGSPWVKAWGLFLLLVDQSQRDRRPSLSGLIRKRLDKRPKDGYNMRGSSSKRASFLILGRDFNVAVISNTIAARISTRAVASATEMTREGR
jgi:hypothetical protein